jgi:hypothetical protein
MLGLVVGTPLTPSMMNTIRQSVALVHIMLKHEQWYFCYIDSAAAAVPHSHVLTRQGGIAGKVELGSGGVRRSISSAIWTLLHRAPPASAYLVSSARAGDPVMWWTGLLLSHPLLHVWCLQVQHQHSSMEQDPDTSHQGECCNSRFRYTAFTQGSCVAMQVLVLQDCCLVLQQTLQRGYQDLQQQQSMLLP